MKAKWWLVAVGVFWLAFAAMNLVTQEPVSWQLVSVMSVGLAIGAFHEAWSD